jgi:hypothetical protein
VGAAMSLTRKFEYGFFDYSLTSPHFFLVRLGWILLILCGAYLWSTLDISVGWSPLITLGQASLVVYWLHIDIVYGRAFHSFAQSMDLSSATLQLMWLGPLMLLAASAKNNMGAVMNRAHVYFEKFTSRSGSRAYRNAVPDPYSCDRS